MKLPDRLRAATQEIHQQLHTVVDLNRLLSDRAEYAAGLRRYLAAVQPAEKWVNTNATQLPQADLPPEFHLRLSKTEWLQQDLKAVASLSDVPPDSSDEPFHLVPSEKHLVSQLGGILYVMEGMTLGAMQISKALKDQMQIDVDTGGRFFVGYGKETRTCWAQLKEWLEGVGHRPDHCDDVAIESAKAVFRHFAHALKAIDQPVLKKGVSS